MSYGAQLIGARSLLGKLDKLAEQVPEGAARGCLKGAMLIEGEAKLLAPVDTGAMRSSIASEPIKNGAQVGPHTDYAAYVEFGTINMNAQPYMTPAVEAKKDAVRRVVGEEVNVEILRQRKQT